MSLQLIEQHGLANDPTFLDKVTAAVFDQAVIMVSAPSISGSAQKQRMELVNDVLLNPAKHSQLFAWVIAGRPVFNSRDQIDDAAITNQIAGLFDPVAQQIMPP